MQKTSARQENLLCDYLDGSRESKDMGVTALRYMCAYYKYLTIGSDRYHIDLNAAARNNEPLDPSYINEILLKDESAKILLRAYYEYRSHAHKNYVVAGTLTKAFAETKLDIKGRYLPRDFTAFFEIRGLVDDDGDEIKGIFVRISQTSILIALVSKNGKDYAASHFHSEIPKDDETIEDVIGKYSNIVLGKATKKDTEKFEEMVRRREYTPDIEITPCGYSEHMHIIFNCILYVTHNPELEEEINIFSMKRSKREWEQKNCTSKSYIFVGRNFEVPKIYSAENILVRGHWKWQPYGVGRMLLKHIFIDPYVKNRTCE